MYDELFFRNTGTITPNQQKKLRNSKICIIGLGGTGGLVFENLVRAGVQNFILFDMDRVELTNFNRQILATIPDLDKPKVSIAKKRAESINSKVKVLDYFEEFDMTKIAKIKSADLLIDCSDNIKTRVKISKACRKLKLRFVFCSAGFSRGMVSLFEPNIDFAKLFGIEQNKIYLTCSSVVSTAASLSASLASTIAINYIIGKPVIMAPEFLFFDLFEKNIFWKKKL